MLKNILKNWPVKIVCIAAALVLWVYVASSLNTIAKLPGDINVKAINLAPDLVAVYDIKTVQIRVMAEPVVWQKISSNSFSAYLDLAGYSAGTHEVDVKVISNIPDVTVVEKNPQKILVSIEPVISKTFPINKRVMGNAAEGLVAGTVEFDVNEAQIIGAKSLVDSVAEVVAIINLNGESATFSKNVNIVAFDDQGKEVSDLEITPSSIKAEISIVKGSNIKTLGIKANITGAPKEGYFISNIAITPSVIDVIGTREAISEAKYISTLPIDVSGTNGNIEKDLGLSIPSGVTLLGSASSKIHILISISSLESKREIKVNTYKVLNYSGNTDELVFNPLDLNVVISGPVEVINKIDSRDIQIKLDLLNKEIPASGLVLALNNENITIPTGVSMVSFSPATVTITKK